MPQDVADAVVAWISDGGTLREFCRQPGMPSRPTIDRWRQQDDAFASRVARARDLGFDVIAEDCLNIADANGLDTRYTEKGEEVTDGDVIQRSKLRVETRLKLLACWDPRRYGNKASIDHSGSVTLENLVAGVGVKADEE